MTISRGRLRFSLGALLAAISVAAIFFAALSYHRPHSAQVMIRMATIDAAAVKKVLKLHALTSLRDSTIKDSTYVWAILDDKELAEIFRYKGRGAPLIGVDSTTMTTWPGVDYLYVYNESSLDGDGTSVDLVGTLGACLAGNRPQIRIECEAKFSHLGITVSGEKSAGPHDMTHRGKLFYKGAQPQGHLVFFEPVDENFGHVVIFDVQ